MTTTRDVRQTIVQLLSNMSESKEVRTYLSRFSEVDHTRFAVIKIGGAILRDRLEETAASLAFLHTVGLTPIVLHGGGPQLDEKLVEAGAATDKIDGLRVTTPEVLDVARETFTAKNIELVEAVRARGVSAHGLTQGAFDAQLLDKDKYGFVGEPTEVHLDLLRSIVDSGAIPILTCLGVAPGGQLVNMNADAATRQLVESVQPMKIIFLTDTGGLLDGDGEIIESINLATDYEPLMESDWVHGGMAVKLSEIKQLLDRSPPDTSVSITTPSALAKELFTHGGAGTMVRRGEVINTFEAKSDVDEDKLTDLIESAFGRSLSNTWWQDVELRTAYISDSYRAAAVVSDIDGFAYLDKFAIHESAQGEGLARPVWSLLASGYPALFWRSRADNRFNAFYLNEADGFINRGDWTVFWMGDNDFGTIERAVKRLTEMPASFEQAHE